MHSTLHLLISLRIKIKDSGLVYVGCSLKSDGDRGHCFVLHFSERSCWFHYKNHLLDQPLFHCQVPHVGCCLVEWRLESGLHLAHHMLLLLVLETRIVSDSKLLKDKNV